MLRFIGIRRHSITFSDTSSLEVLADKPLRVVGGLPHGTSFEPLTIDDAQALIDWLEDWKQAH